MTFGMPFLLENTTVEEACALCCRLGLSFVELNLNFPACGLDTLDVQRLMEWKKRYGIDFTLHLEEDCDPFHFNASVRRAWVDSLRRAMILAQAIGAGVINMHLPKGIYITLPQERAYLYQRYGDEYRSAVLALRDLCHEELKGTGTRMVIENTDGFVSHEKEAIETLLQSPVFGLTLDIGHSHAVGDCDISFYMKHADRLIHMHGHDARGTKNHLPLGQGEIDLAARFAWAEDHYARVVLETKTIAALEESMAWLREHNLK